MKTLLTTILLLTLVACSSGATETATKSDQAENVVLAQQETQEISVAPETPEAPQVIQEPVIETPQVTCNPWTYNPCALPSTEPDVIPVNEFCNFWTYIPCRAYPPVCTAGKTLVQGICTVI